MKLSFTTLGCPEWSFEKILEEAARIGFQGIEIRGIDGVMRAEEIPPLYPENLEKTKKRLRELNLELVGFGTSASFHDPEKREENLAEARKAIDVCGAAGIPFIRVFGDQIPDKQRAAETIRAVGSAIASLCAYAEDKGVNVLLEVHGEFNTIETVSGVIESCKAYRSFGILWDIEHSDRAYKDNWRPFYQLVRPYLKHLHIKDYIRNSDGTFRLCLVGEGDIPVRDIVSALRRDGYSGYYSLEWEKKWHPELPDPSIALPAYFELMKGLDENR